VFKVLMSLASIALLLWSCGPDSRNKCSGQDPDFQVLLKLAGRPLPADTVVHITYGGSATEEFRLSDRNARHEVAFCQVADEGGAPLDASAAQSMGTAGAAGSADAGGDAGAAGAAGAAGIAGAGGSVDPPEVVPALFCKFWTSGFTQIKVSGTGFATVEYELAPKGGLCTVEKEYTLDAPDAG